MKTLRIGIAGYERMKARTMAIARGEHKPVRGEPTVWFTSIESFAKVLPQRNPGASGDDWAREAGLGHRARGSLRAEQVEPVADAQDDVALRFGGVEGGGARHAGAMGPVRSGAAGCLVDAAAARSLARLARSTPWIQGPQVHLTHQALDPLAVDRVAALLQLVTHPPAAVEWPLEIDLVDEPHHSKVRLATVVPRSSVAHRATRSAASWTIRASRESGLGAHSPVAPEHLGQKIVLHRQPTDLGVELLYLLLVVLGLDRVGAEHILGAFDQVLLPVLDLTGVNIKLLSRLRHSAFALQR